MVETDEEQIEVIKNWWDQNGSSLLTTIALVLVGTFGYRAWEDSVRESGETASRSYENLIQATSGLEDENIRASALILGEELKSEHAGTAYSIFAAFHLAKLAVEQGQLDKAHSELDWVIEQEPEHHMEVIARMRLARVLVAKGNASAAMEKLVNFEPDNSQRASWEEVKGDVFLALDDKGNARQSYQIALELLNDSRSRPLLELKLADIPNTSLGYQDEEGT